MAWQIGPEKHMSCFIRTQKKSRSPFLMLAQEGTNIYTHVYAKSLRRTTWWPIAPSPNLPETTITPSTGPHLCYPPRHQPAYLDSTQHAISNHILMHNATHGANTRPTYWHDPSRHIPTPVCRERSRDGYWWVTNATAAIITKYSGLNLLYLFYVWLIL